jgi:hypothetical protein
MQGNNEVRFELPDYVKATDEAFDDAEVTVEYDSNYNGRGETATVSGKAELVGVGDHFTDTALVVGGRHIQSNGHVFNNDGRHLGAVESVTATVNKEVAIELVTEHVDHDVDCGEEEIIVQTWDTSVMEQEGFMAGTDEIRMVRV